MYLENLQKLREEREMSHRELSALLGFKRQTYTTWESGNILISLKNIDKLAVFYNVSLTYILGLNNSLEKNIKINPLDYQSLLNSINSLKQEKNISYINLGKILKCNKSTCFRYFKGLIPIPIDKLILLSEFFEINIDKLCGKI